MHGRSGSGDVSRAIRSAASARKVFIWDAAWWTSRACRPVHSSQTTKASGSCRLRCTRSAKQPGSRRVARARGTSRDSSRSPWPGAGQRPVSAARATQRLVIRPGRNEQVLEKVAGVRDACPRAVACPLDEGRADKPPSTFLAAELLGGTGTCCAATAKEAHGWSVTCGAHESATQKRGGCARLIPVSCPHQETCLVQAANSWSGHEGTGTLVTAPDQPCTR